MLEDLMREKDINQVELQRETGVPQPTISRFINGETKSLKFDTLKVLAEYFDVPMDKIVR
ncbi:helix-turn-helix transcriptional regulator [Porticoccaceae bacterium]|nr:helix-turn-helix transcriptional regulator [Porticoccaceae bacterium]MDA8652226.1 helix-turn-helix transcriptional regulator [Porticoccaceae bacterium]MDA8682861.1 helix-turn-helix transcriptional regulator [Porticoccaceae bacterium]MDA8788615.1 helix-turn-helix transcriptional regulator [Porticoccaceae bacterium]MDB2344462.1 helix-turn-helix transcriptional regulator [Porticoccaceae bacterium]